MILSVVLLIGVCIWWFSIWSRDQKKNSKKVSKIVSKSVQGCVYGGIGVIWVHKGLDVIQTLYYIIILLQKTFQIKKSFSVFRTFLHFFLDAVFIDITVFTCEQIRRFSRRPIYRQCYSNYNLQSIIQLLLNNNKCYYKTQKYD